MERNDYIHREEKRRDGGREEEGERERERMTEYFYILLFISSITKC